MMIEAGVLEDPKPESIVAQHVFPELEAGKVGFRPGMYMASCDEVFITVKGKGGHAAMPHQVIDPVLIASHVVVGLQQIISRRKKPESPSVLSFGVIQGGGATNVIPDEVKLEGTFRAMDEEWRAQAHQLIEQMANDIAASMGGSCVVEVKKGYPYLENHPALTERTRAAAEAYLGAENVVDLPLRLTGEDFAFYSQEMPACFYRLGVRNEAKGITASVHNARFDIDEAALEIGAGLMAWLAVQELEEG